MPLYLFFSEAKNEYREVFFGMNDDKVYNGEDGTEIGLWARRWTVPNAAIDSISNSDPFNIREAVEKTRSKKGTMGDLWDASRELSEARADKVGAEDPLKRKHFDKYEKEIGVKHFHDKPSKIDTKTATIDFTKGSLFGDD